MSDIIGTDEQSKAVGKVAEMGTEAVKAASKAGGFLASIIQDVPNDLVGYYLGGDWLHHKRLKNLADLEASTAAHLKGIAAERRTEPSPSVLIPLLTFAADETREGLQDLWARLLANAMIDGGRKVRRDFFETVSRMEPIDALVLKAFFEARVAPNMGGVDKQETLDVVNNRIPQPLSALEFDVSIEALEGLRCPAKSANGLPVVPQFGKSLMVALAVT